ncbi:MaoC family dehydratase [Ruegeria sp.]|uniref:MaoC family dehydratase n=1 Tax=Ruegeria sp. TaxID=1879320 RepID=UPI003B5B7440
MTRTDEALEQLERTIGQEIGTSDWIEITQEVIDSFADVTHDHQWIHLDPEKAAKETPYGGTIAHGFLTLSLCSRFARDVIAPMDGEAMAINYGFNKLRFLSPVPSGSRIRGRFHLQNVTRKGDTSILRTMDLSVEIEGGDTPALVAEWLGMIVFE